MLCEPNDVIEFRIPICPLDPHTPRPTTLRLTKSEMKYILAEQVYRSGQILLAHDLAHPRLGLSRANLSAFAPVTHSLMVCEYHVQIVYHKNRYQYYQRNNFEICLPVALSCELIKKQPHKVFETIIKNYESECFPPVVMPRRPTREVYIMDCSFSTHWHTKKAKIKTL